MVLAKSILAGALCFADSEKPYINTGERNGGDDETRTRDLCRDSPESYGNYLKLRGTDGYQKRALEPSVTIIGP